jgi:hypothetical protein
MLHDPGSIRWAIPWGRKSSMSDRSAGHKPNFLRKSASQWLRLKEVSDTTYILPTTLSSLVTMKIPSWSFTHLRKPPRGLPVFKEKYSRTLGSFSTS